MKLLLGIFEQVIMRVMRVQVIRHVKLSKNLMLCNNNRQLPPKYYIQIYLLFTPKGKCKLVLQLYYYDYIFRVKSATFFINLFVAAI